MTLNMNDMKSSKKKYPRIEEGTYMARISSIIDLGIQPQTDWKTGEPTDSKPRVLFTWTLPTEKLDIEREDGTVESVPRVISKEYTLSNNERANLTKLISALKPGVSSLSELSNEACMVSVGSTITGNAKVTNVVRAPTGMQIEELERDAIFFDFDAPEEDTYLLQPNWIRNKIKDAENYSGFADGWDMDEAA